MIVFHVIQIVEGEREREKDFDNGENSTEPEEIKKVKRSSKQDWQGVGRMKDLDMLQLRTPSNIFCQ